VEGATDPQRHVVERVRGGHEDDVPSRVDEALPATDVVSIRRRVRPVVITEVLDGLAKNGDEGNAAVEADVKKRAVELCGRFPIYR